MSRSGMISSPCSSSRARNSWTLINRRTLPPRAPRAPNQVLTPRQNSTLPVRKSIIASGRSSRNSSHGCENRRSILPSVCVLIRACRAGGTRIFSCDAYPALKGGAITLRRASRDWLCRNSSGLPRPHPAIFCEKPIYALFANRAHDVVPYGVNFADGAGFFGSRNAHFETDGGGGRVRYPGNLWIGHYCSQPFGNIVQGEKR